jgi:leucyl aminopeptidase
MITFIENSQAQAQSWLRLFESFEQAKPFFSSHLHQYIKEEFAFGANHCFAVETDEAKIFVYILPNHHNQHDLVLAFRRFWFHQKKRVRGNLRVIFDFVEADQPKQAAQYCAMGLELGAYEIGLYKSDVSRASFWVDFKHEFPESLLESLQKGQTLAKGKILAMDLVNGASNRVNPRFLAESLINLKTQDCSVFQVWNQDLTKERLNGIHAIGKGSNEAGLVFLDYSPNRFSHTLALVGKGVTFDSGGISIKDSQNLHWLKSDMGGAAAVIGAVYVALAYRLPLRIVTVLPLCENMPDGNSIKPGDVIQTHSGKTVEIIDTDAEGRVILADSISWLLERCQPDTLIDLATLTGASVYALGYQAAALCTPNTELRQELMQISEISERIWPLPMWKEYESALASDVADLKNFSGPAGGAILAAKFIEAFTQSHKRWAHIDMASMVLSSNEFAKDRTATGFGVELLVSYMVHLSRS